MMLEAVTTILPIIFDAIVPRQRIGNYLITINLYYMLENVLVF